MPMTLSIQITKFEFHQYEMRAVLPNLMLTKVTRYTCTLASHVLCNRYI